MSGPAVVTKPGVYVVKPGDTLWGIARKNGISIDELLRLNGLPDTFSVIQAGQKLKVPVVAPAVRPAAPADRTRRIEFTLTPADLLLMPEPERNAQAVFEVLAADPMVVAMFKRGIKLGNPPNTPPGVQVVGRVALARVAAMADNAGYPLTEDGLLRLKRVNAIDEEGVGHRTASALVDLLLEREHQVGPLRRLLTSREETFIQRIADAARESMQETGVPASVTMAQCVLETDWGRAVIGGAKNYFGIKGVGPAGSVMVRTREFVNGKWVTVRDRFRAYHSMAESFVDHANLLADSQTYARAMAVKDDPRRFAAALQRAGYATDPAYAKKLIQIMNEFKLYRFDRVST